jgi:hypothetical protein
MIAVAGEGPVNDPITVAVMMNASIVIVISVFDARLAMSIFVSLSAALQARKCE